MKESFYIEFNIHMHIDRRKYPELGEKVRRLKAKRKLNKYLLQALNEIVEKEKQLDLFN